MMKLNNTSKAIVLLLCSDSDVLGVLRAMLESTDYVVLPASNLASAVEQLEDVTPDLLIVRPYLESISGHEAAVYLRTKCNGMRVLMVGGLPNHERILYRESLHAVEIFPKPFTADEFLQKVASILTPARSVGAGI